MQPIDPRIRLNPLFKLAEGLCCCSVTYSWPATPRRTSTLPKQRARSTHQLSLRCSRRQSYNRYREQQVPMVPQATAESQQEQQHDQEEADMQQEASTSQQQPSVQDDVIGRMSHYAMPNIASMLPNYSNAEQEFVFRTFNVGNYDLLKHLPDTLKEQQVMAMRTARMDATRRFLMPALAQPLIRSKPDNQQDLFSTFEYIPSRYSLADELASKERVESEAKRMAVGGREFVPSGLINHPKHKDMSGEATFTRLGGAFEDVDEAQLAQAWTERAGAVTAKPWVQPGVDKLGDRPTKQAAWEMMTNIRKWVAKDWEGADVSIFENEHDCWVVRVPLEKVDSEQGLLAYMNVFVRCNELVTEYQVSKVVDFWGTTPGDGSMYFVLRPPWVKPDRIATYYALFPEEKDWQTSTAVVEMARTRPPKKESDYPPELTNTSALSYSTRLAWGTNFLTGTAASAPLGKVKPGCP